MNKVSINDKLGTNKKGRFLANYSKPEVKGNVSMAAQATGINRQTYYDWLDQDEKFRGQVYELKMQMCDEMEQVLIERAVRTDTTALIYWLKFNHPTYKEQPVQINQQFNVSFTRGEDDA